MTLRRQTSDAPVAPSTPNRDGPSTNGRAGSPNGSVSLPSNGLGRSATTPASPTTVRRQLRHAALLRHRQRLESAKGPTTKRGAAVVTKAAGLPVSLARRGAAVVTKAAGLLVSLARRAAAVVTKAAGLPVSLARRAAAVVTKAAGLPVSLARRAAAVVTKAAGLPVSLARRGAAVVTKAAGLPVSLARRAAHIAFLPVNCALRLRNLALLQPPADEGPTALPTADGTPARPLYTRSITRLGMVTSAAALPVRLFAKVHRLRRSGADEQPRSTLAPARSPARQIDWAGIPKRSLTILAGAPSTLAHLPRRLSRTGDGNQVQLDNEPKPVPTLPFCYLMSHVEEDGPVRIDGMKVALTEIMGMELTISKLEAFTGFLNALEFPVQLLIRQHPPQLGALRQKLRAARPNDLSPEVASTADSLDKLLLGLETRKGILDRRYYAICNLEHLDELRSLMDPLGLQARQLTGRHLRQFLMSTVLGGTPKDRDTRGETHVQVAPREIQVGRHLTRSLHVAQWPRTLNPTFIPRLLTTGAPMDLSIHIGPIPSEQASRTLQWQQVRIQSAKALATKKGHVSTPETDIALEDILRLQDAVQRGRQRLFHSSLSITVHADTHAALKDATQKVQVHFGATLGRIDRLSYRQQEGMLATMPLGTNPLSSWRTLDTSSLVQLFPFSPPDLDTRRGTFYGIDLRASAPIIIDPFDGTHMNANTSVLASSGAGKSFAIKLIEALRGAQRGVISYIIDPDGEYVNMAKAASGRVFTPGLPGQGMNPFVIDQGDTEEALQRIGNLRRLIEVMVGETLSAERRAMIDHALTGYYNLRTPDTGFRQFYDYLSAQGMEDLHNLLRPFATGSLRHLLSDEGSDLLQNEAPITVFDLHLLEPELRPAAAMVCIETIWTAAARDPKPRKLIIDEVWSIMQHEQGAAFVLSVSKRARKHTLGLTTITQDVQDLLSEDPSRGIAGHSGRTVIQNAAIKLLLKQDEAAIPAVGAAFDLPQDLQTWLLHCARGSGVLVAHGMKAPIRIEATPQEAELIDWTPGYQHLKPAAQAA